MPGKIFIEIDGCQKEQTDEQLSACLSVTWDETISTKKRQKNESDTNADRIEMWPSMRQNQPDMVIKHMGHAGWGVFTKDPIKAGSFVCQYAGDFLTDKKKVMGPYSVTLMQNVSTYTDTSSLKVSIR